MPIEIDKDILNYASQLFQLLGFSSILGFITLYSACLAFPPEIIVDAITDKSVRLNSESRIKIKNTGRLPALKIKTEIENLNATIAGIQMHNCSIKDGLKIIPRLSRGETAEFSISPGISTAHGVQLSEFNYILNISCHTKLFFIKRTFKKKWKVELRNFKDGFAWCANIIG